MSALRAERGTARERRRSDDGTAVVEFALVAPVFIVLVFGVISFGIVFAQNLALGNGAREAARSAVVENRTCGQIRTTAKDAANSIAMQGTNVTVSIKRGQSAATATNACTGGDSINPCSGSAPGDSIYVRLDFTSRLIIPLALVKDSYPISGDGVFRCEFS
ncbi:MAG TPA: TadE/TadG family type IV pilus assembly protein [Marmoricola sp.]|nr:TadE/TadG family type IV pilus assembly protein [Marmoricola sp.]